jgi:predicted Zn-dependent protease
MLSASLSRLPRPSRLAAFALFAVLSQVPAAAASVPAGESAAWSASFAREYAGDFAGALAALEALRAAPSDPYLLALRSAWLDHRMGKEEAALVAYGQAGAQKPGALEPQLGEMTGYLALRRWSEAEIAACVVLKAAPGHYGASCGLIEALIGSGRAREAAELVKPLIEHFPADATVLDLGVRAREAAGDNPAELCARLAILRLAAGPQVAKR